MNTELKTPPNNTKNVGALQSTTPSALLLLLLIEDEGDVDPIELALFDEPAVVDSEGLDEDFVCELKLESAELKIEEAAVDAPLLTAGDEVD